MAGTPEYFQLRPGVEQVDGYTHAVKLGSELKIAGAASMDAEGTPAAVRELEQQTKHACADPDAVLKHDGCTFEDVVVEAVCSTRMATFLEVAAYRNTNSTKHCPTGT